MHCLPFQGESFLFNCLVYQTYVFRPLWASTFSLRGQRKGTKRKATLPCWPSAALCASAWSGHCETRCAQTVLALIRSRLPVLDNTKGIIKIKDKVKTYVAAETLLLTSSPLFRHAVVGLYP